MCYQDFSITSKDSKIAINRNIEGIVVKGKKVGRTLGFPTANLSLITKNHSFKHGVYGVTVSIDNIDHNGIMNIGIRPTIDKKSEVTYEIHLFDFNENLYDKKLNVQIRFFLREEMKFPNINSLIEQIKKDCITVKAFM